MLVEVLTITFVVLQIMYIKQDITTQISCIKHVLKRCTEVTYNDIISIMLRIKSNHATVLIPTGSTNILQLKYL
jgi:hypothetical protein